MALAQATVVTAADGTTHLAPLEGDTPVARGAVIRYTVTAKDTGTDAARHLALTGRIPSATAFVPGSIHGLGGHADYSLDGKTFAVRPMVATTTPTGTVMVPADPGQYVMVRWTMDGALAPAASASFSYDVRLK